MGEIVLGGESGGSAVEGDGGTEVERGDGEDFEEEVTGMGG